jgi:oligopeptide transport system ATP-binding protein
VALLEVRNLVKTYSSDGPFGAGSRNAAGVRAVDDVSLDIEPGETLGLVGESGSGKSTLGRLILRLIEPDSGSVRFDGRDVLAASSREMRGLRRHMQIVFQDPFSSLDPRMRVRDIVSEPLKIHGADGDSSEAAWDPANLMRLVGLDASALARYPHEFSGGQRQRISIARALALRPKLIVCDEPVSALDVSVGAQIINLLAQLQRDFGVAYLFISHSMPVVRYLAARIAVMHRGKLVEIGTAEQITSNPSHPYTQQLLAATPEL